MSYTHKAASYIAKAEGGLSEAKIHEIREIIRIMKDQHIESGRGVKSFLLALLNEARAEKKAKARAKAEMRRNAKRKA